jgi:hypothetical protein
MFVYDVKKGVFVDFFSLVSNIVLSLQAIYSNTKNYI